MVKTYPSDVSNLPVALEAMLALVKCGCERGCSEERHCVCLRNALPCTNAYACNDCENEFLEKAYSCNDSDDEEDEEDTTDCIMSFCLTIPKYISVSFLFIITFLKVICFTET